MIVSGIDDLWLDLCYLVKSRKPKTPVPAGLDEQLIAVWIPAWHEAEVIARMVAHNVSSIRYRR